MSDTNAGRELCGSPLGRHIQAPTLNLIGLRGAQRGSVDVGGGVIVLPRFGESIETM